MKLGIEVEGRLLGVKTVFIDATESLSDALNACESNGASHLYISDPSSTYLTDAGLTKLRDADVLVTLEVHTPVANFGLLDVPNNVHLMVTLNVPHAMFAVAASLRDSDTIKIHSGQNVLCWTRGHATRTTPDQFDGDTLL